MQLKAIAINCSLKSAGSGRSSTQLMLERQMAALAAHGVQGDILRAVDHDIRPGVTSDEGPGDAWPPIRSAILDSHILLIGTPIWLGSPSSVCRRVLERLDAFLGEADDAGRMPSYGRVALVACVGNEDGAHNVSAALYQALSDVGFTVPPNALAYWVGEAMSGTDFKDLPQVPEKVQSTLRQCASNAVHLARMLAERPYPGSA